MYTANIAEKGNSISKKNRNGQCTVGKSKNEGMRSDRLGG